MSPVQKASGERHSIYSPVPNRESFIDRKIRELNNGAENKDFGR
jgi:hypothetical protein